MAIGVDLDPRPRSVRSDMSLLGLSDRILGVSKGSFKRRDLLNNLSANKMQWTLLSCAEWVHFQGKRGSSFKWFCLPSEKSSTP